MSSSVVVLETKAARVSLARPVHSCLHKFLETPVTKAKHGSCCVQVSFVNCPQPRSISNSPAFLACMFCFPIADHVMLACCPRELFLSNAEVVDFVSGFDRGGDLTTQMSSVSSPEPLDFICI